MDTQKSILVIEDTEEIRELYRDILEEAGYKVTICNNGQDGLNKVRAEKYDLILLDLVMPKIDGLTFLEILTRENGGKLPTRIIVLSNLVNDVAIDKAMQLGIAGYLDKTSILPDQLIEKVKNTIS